MVREEDVRRFERTHLMIKWMCNASVKDRKSLNVLRSCLGLTNVRDVMCRNRLSWFVYVKRLDGENWMKHVMELEVSGGRRVGRPRKTWWEVVNSGVAEEGP